MHGQEDYRRFFQGNGAAQQCVCHALKDATIIRIATAFFEPSGWDALRTVLQGRDIRLLLGRPDDADDKIGDVVHDFFRSLNTGIFDERIQIMQEIRDAIRNGKFLISLSSEDCGQTLLDPRYLFHHAKLYIADEAKAVVTSANCTRHGLTQSREAGITVTDPDDVLFFVERFDYYHERGKKIADLLLAEIEEWLKIYRPYQIYMLSLLLLYGLPADEKPGHLPALSAYQRPVVSRVIRNIEEYGGCMLVASTGLGKTIMAAHAVAHLHSQRFISAAIVVCPAGLKSMWHRTMRATRISSIEFSYQVFSLEDWRKYKDVAVLERELALVDSQTLVILDESHHLRNSEDGSNLRLRHQRIRQLVDKGAKTLLMTATPYSRDVADINAQLRLLPHRHNTPGMLSHDSTAPWQVNTPAALSELECGVVLAMPSVVKNFSALDENGNRYVLFSGDNRRYFPRKIILTNIRYANQADDALIELLESGILAIEEHNNTTAQENLFDDFSAEGRRDPLNEARIVHQFCSSLKEADTVLAKMSHAGGFESIRFAHQNELSKKSIAMRKSVAPLLHDKSKHTRKSDAKIRAMLEILDTWPGQKVVIFCHYLETAGYVVSCIEHNRPEICVRTTAGKDPDDLEAIIQGFAPVANSVDLPDGETPANPFDEVDVLVATTAMSEGFNFQDAAILINFDLPWTVLVLAQRMGRILRPWITPRDVYLYTLMPSTMEEPRIRHACKWKERLHNRSKEFSSFAEIPVLVDTDERFSMVDLAQSMCRLDDEIELDVSQVYEFIEKADALKTSSFLDDLALLTLDEARRLQRLPDGIKSFKDSGLPHPLLYVLFRYKDSCFPALFDLKGKLLMDHVQIDEIMRMIRANEDEEPLVRLGDNLNLDELCNTVIKSWATEKNVSLDDFSIRCFMILE
ncbi:MAG TPA: helicase-related protein [Spirochaetota bacterium]|nr:helicase-related protein [Spirochaetota bacterium]